jgi:hypothetical protein
MPQTAVDSVSVWGIPPILKQKLNLTCLASSRGRQSGGVGHTGIGDLAVCPISLLIFCAGVNSTAVNLKIYIFSMI